MPSPERRLAAALDALERPVAFWWRDDDAGRDHPRLRRLLALARAQDVNAVLVDAAGGRQWRRVLDPVLRGRTLGGMTLYRLDRERPNCRQD